MYSLLQFIIRHHFLFLFALLQSFALFLYINSHHYQRAGFVNSANSVTGNVYDVVNNVSEYFLLKQENELLSEEIERLRALVDESLIQKNASFLIKEDTLYEQFYTYTAAKVINATTHRVNNYLTLNKGASDGLEKDMGVISASGAVGVVKDVSDHFATVIPLINQANTGLSVRIKRNQNFGFLSWDGQNPNIAQIENMSITTDVAVGDTIETSGFSRQFPSAVIVGTVEEVIQQEELSTLLIEVRLNVNFHQVNHVQVVQNLHKKEWEKIEEEIEE